MRSQTKRDANLDVGIKITNRMGDKTTEILPQVGTGLSGESHSSLTEGCPVDSGGDNLPFSFEKTGYLSSGVAWQDIPNPFARRSSILRSPPARDRANSAPNLESIGSTQPTKKHKVGEQKRKREESPKLEKSREQKQFLKILGCLKQNIASLQEVVRSGYKVKTEIKEATGRLALCMENLMKEDMRVWIHDATKTPPQDREKQGRTVSEDVEKETQQERERETRDMATQTEYRERPNPNTARIGERIKQITDRGLQGADVEEVKRLTQEEWPKEVYQTCKIVSGGVIKAAKLEDVVIFVDNETEEGNPLIKQLSEIQPEVGEVIRKGSVKPGKVVYTTSCSKIIDENETSETNTRVMYLAGLEGESAGDVETLITVLEKIKNISNKERKKGFIAVCTKEGMEVILQKVIELVFGGEGYNVVLHMKKHRKQTDGQQDDKQWQVQRRSNQRARRETILVKPTTEGKTYADLLREMKKNIDIDELDVKINNVEKTREGYVKLNIFRGKKGNGESIKAAVQDKMRNIAEVQLKKKRKNVVILDMDDITTEDEIYEALKSVLQDAKRDDITIKMSPKANNRGLQYANIQLPSDEANVLLEMQRIKIGWTRCRVVERLAPAKCYRCQNYGHYASSCKSETDMSGKCLKCGEDGHKIKLCTNEAFCSACKIKGHTSNEMVCPVYKKLMDELRRKKVNVRYTSKD